MVPAAFTKPAPAPKKKSSILSIAVTAFIVPGLFATIALPAYAYKAPESTAGADAAAALTELREGSAQSVAVAADAVAGPTARDVFTATTPEELAAARAAIAAAKAEKAAAERRAALAAAYSAYKGPTASNYLAKPAHPNFSLDGVVQVALQYQGVPYRYGGADPSGFDCSGFVMFVYAQFGISLPHSASAQGRLGTRIAPQDARPGDVVIVDGGSHDGIYVGGGQFIDAPYAGRTVQVRPIYTSNHYFVRYGI